MEDFFQQIWTLVATFADPRNLGDPQIYINALKQPGVMWAAFAAVNAIVFTETGLLVGFLLPGDSLLVVTGIVAFTANWPIVPLAVSLCIAAVVGDSLGYYIGAKAGPAIFRRPDGRFFRQEYLATARAYYERHGGKTIIIARFIPIIRTFVPVVAGAAKMEYRTFLTYNIFGGIGWILSMLMLGYMLDPMLKQMLGEQFQIAKHIDKVVVIVVGLSVAPLFYKGFKHWLGKRKAARLTAGTPTSPHA